MFRPERFIDDSDTGYEWPRHACKSYQLHELETMLSSDTGLPFITGPRVCIGQRFAMLETVCIIARVLRRYGPDPSAYLAGLIFK